MEMGYPTLKTLSTKHDEENAKIIRSNLDMAEEMREMAAIKLQLYQQEVARQYNKTIIERIFKKGDWIILDPKKIEDRLVQLQDLNSSSQEPDSSSSNWKAESGALEQICHAGSTDQEFSSHTQASEQRVQNPTLK
ncbi:hypothetical protein TIFTF001_028447 [Ficus carica]|uniref:Uncharacterized protein n=1 Tax=Ficus carica TaxID=3494 RepID=A0AA88J1I2_FICCA|nr:hypothetical protein TIFTF001_028447 [Ficus carica]